MLNLASPPFAQAKGLFSVWLMSLENEVRKSEIRIGSVDALKGLKILRNVNKAGRKHTRRFLLSRAPKILIFHATVFSFRELCIIKEELERPIQLATGFERRMGFFEWKVAGALCLRYWNELWAY